MFCSLSLPRICDTTGIQSQDKKLKQVLDIFILWGKMPMFLEKLLDEEKYLICNLLQVDNTRRPRGRHKESMDYLDLLLDNVTVYSYISNEYWLP